MVQLTVKVPFNEVDALRFACAHTDESVFVHESTESDALLATVTIQVRDVEMLFYVVRSFDAKVEYDKAKAETDKFRAENPAV